MVANTNKIRLDTMKRYKKKHRQIHTYWPKQDSKKKLWDNTANGLSSHKNVRAILNVPDSTTFCILFIHSLLLLPTISYIVVYCISRDHPPRASMMTFLGKPRNISVWFPVLYTSGTFITIIAHPNSARFRIISTDILTSITFKLFFKFIFGTDRNAPITTGIIDCEQSLIFLCKVTARET